MRLNTLRMIQRYTIENMVKKNVEILKYVQEN